MKQYTIIIFLVLLSNSCKNDKVKREIASDRVVHIEDSIHYNIPILPPLCDSLQLEVKKVNIGDCDLYVEQEGKGVPIVLINGGPGGTHHYFHPEFSTIKDEHKIIYYDQRGTGQSDFISGKGYSFEQAADDLEKLRIELGISNWVICGFSYGGGLAQFYSVKYPDKVLGLVLISSLPLYDDENFQSEQEKYLSQLEKQKKNEIIKEYAKGNLKMKPFLYNLALNGDWKRQRYYKPTKNEMVRSALYEWINDKSFNSTMSESYRSYDFRGLFDNCPIPTLIFEGKHDLTWGSKKATTFKVNHPNAKMVVLEHAGHMVYRDNPNLFFKELLRFTASLKPINKNELLIWRTTSLSNFIN